MEKEKRDAVKKTLGSTSDTSFAQKAVKQYEAAEAELLAFMQDQDALPVLQQYHALVESRNSKLGDAIQAVKAALQRSTKPKLTVGSLGAQKKISHEYDVGFLRENLPQEQLDLFVTEEITYKVNEELLAALTRQGEVDAEIVKQAYKEKPASLANLPGTPKVWSLPGLPTE